MKLARLAVLALLAGAQPVFAQQNGNVYDWEAHQPTEAQVKKREERAGVAPSGPALSSEDRELKRLDRELLDAERSHPPEQAPR